LLFNSPKKFFLTKEKKYDILILEKGVNREEIEGRRRVI